jgi:ankyrin repeat protein
MLLPWATAIPDAYDDLRIHSLFGNLSMVRYLLHLGVPVQRPNIFFETPLVMACRGLHHDVVDLLLEHRANPNFSGHSAMPVLPLHESTTAGDLTLTRKLLARGTFPTPTKLGNGKYPALW